MFDENMDYSSVEKVNTIAYLNERDTKLKNNRKNKRKQKESNRGLINVAVEK